MRVNVHPHDGVEVVLPRGEPEPERAAARAVAQLAPWIERRLAESEHVRARVRAHSSAGTVPLLGETLTLVPQPGRARVTRRGGLLLVPADLAAARPALERYYRATARREIGARVAAAAGRHGTPYRAMSIRGQRTRWGSCSANGSLSFNWRLLLAPSFVLDYVIEHELCHLVVMDHSREFWALLERRLPDYRAAAAWLRDNGASLVLA